MRYQVVQTNKRIGSAHRIPGIFRVFVLVLIDIRAGESHDERLFRPGFAEMSYGIDTTPGMQGYKRIAGFTVVFSNHVDRVPGTFQQGLPPFRRCPVSCFRTRLRRRDHYQMHCL